MHFDASFIVNSTTLIALLFVANTVECAPRIRGVNLGGWLVLERWIKPSMFKDGWENNGDCNSCHFL